MAPTPEGKIKAAVMKAVRKRGHVIYTAFGDGHMVTGFPDKFGLLTHPPNVAGKFFGLELKAPGKKPSPAQISRLQEIEEGGGFAGWADSVETAMDCFDEWEATR